MNFNAGQIALLGLFGTLAAAVASLAAAWVAGKMQIRSDAASAHRDYLLREFAPLLTHLVERPRAFTRLATVFRNGTPQQIDAACHEFILSGQTAVDPMVLPLIQRKDYMVLAMLHWTDTEVLVTKAAQEHRMGIRVVTGDEAGRLNQTLMFASMLFHEAIQRLIFEDTRGRVSSRKERRLDRRITAARELAALQGVGAEPIKRSPLRRAINRFGQWLIR
jgi:hypothetical protein